MICFECGCKELEKVTDETLLYRDHDLGEIEVPHVDWIECPCCHSRLFSPPTCRAIELAIEKGVEELEKYF